MLVAMAGAMSTAELGISLSDMIRQKKVHAVCTTGANLEEDLFNLVAHDSYRRIPNWRNLTRRDEKDLERAGLNRVTDTCIPEEEAFRVIEKTVFDAWKAADVEGRSRFPHEFLYDVVRSGALSDRYEIEPEDSWIVAAAEHDLPLFVPGWEDSTLGNFFVAHVLAGRLTRMDTVRSGLEYMAALAEWYSLTTSGRSLQDLEGIGADTRDPLGAGRLRSVGFFQVGGGIAGDFPICVVPMIHQDLKRACPYWGYFCQISDSTTSYGSYSGATPSEKISWGKLDIDTPMFVIESDATIVVPLIFAHVLGW